MPLGVTSEEDAQVNEDYPYLPVDADVEETLAEHLSQRIAMNNEIATLTGSKKMLDGFIHEIVNEYLYTEETENTLKGGYTIEGEDGEQVQIQVTKRYPAKTSKIKAKKGQSPKETEEGILNLAEIFELKRNEDGTFPFPAGTFVYKDTIKVDPSKVHPDMFDDFIEDVKKLGQKYKQGRMNPVSESTQLVAAPNFHLGRLKLSKEKNLRLHEIFQNITIKLLNEEEK